MHISFHNNHLIENILCEFCMKIFVNSGRVRIVVATWNSGQMSQWEWETLTESKSQAEAGDWNRMTRREQEQEKYNGFIMSRVKMPSLNNVLFRVWFRARSFESIFCIDQTHTQFLVSENLQILRFARDKIDVQWFRCHQQWRWR